MSVFEDIAFLNKKGMVFGVETTRRILDALGSPDKNLKIVHIAGTNGKGSIAEYITRILIASGKRVGTFSSPMVENYFDQFRIDGEPVEESVLAKYFGEAYSAADSVATGFEVETAGILNAFSGEGCEYAVVECGLGGKLDATNAMANKEVAVISSVGLEHTAVLGNSLRSICEHKAGIIRDCPVVVNALQEAETAEYFRTLGAIFADKRFEFLSADLNGTRFAYDGEEYFTPMYGRAQAYDAATAIEAARILKIDKNSIRVGISRTKLSGRLQIMQALGNTYIIDGGHNPSGMKPLRELLSSFGGKKITLVYGSLSDKDIDGNLFNLRGLPKKVYAVTPESPRAMDRDKLLSACKKYFADVEYADSVSDALSASDGVVAVCGSFTLVKEALNWIEKRL